MLIKMVPSRHRKKRKRSVERQEIHFLTQEAMTFLIEESMKTRLTNPRRSRELFCSSRKIGKRGRLHLPRQYRCYFCRSCNFPISVNTTRIRLNSKKRQIHYFCLNCKKEQRISY
jgi:RNase P subunit RPR2